MKVILERLDAKVNENASDAGKFISLVDGFYIVNDKYRYFLAWDNVSYETVRNCIKRHGLWFHKESTSSVKVLRI